MSTRGRAREISRVERERERASSRSITRCYGSLLITIEAMEMHRLDFGIVSSSGCRFDDDDVDYDDDLDGDKDDGDDDDDNDDDDEHEEDVVFCVPYCCLK